LCSKRSLGILLKKRKEKKREKKRKERGQMSHLEIKRDLEAQVSSQILQVF
jgi:hypothetical protein